MKSSSSSLLLLLECLLSESALALPGSPRNPRRPLPPTFHPPAGLPLPQLREETEAGLVAEERPPTGLPVRDNPAGSTGLPVRLPPPKML